MFGLFRRTDPVCRMKEEKDKGISKHDKWFCSQNCLSEFEKQASKAKKHGSGCCH